ncbi:MAG: hypothetical protein UU48_C0001G0007 [Candidatus Uhrbacteria bacterium GW2011_GWF2_41_16]|uniref:PI3K/PI4K catalytic domain-containing protein n=2 Tax=Candidatus Uhriibacteriota TaxID=1752732 RepID=A0A0G0YEC1_9BACT|nr:MAG: hypothetical protein UU35_C0022G0009 [Candidatus Uhrbacteria bacterium GW2011_GWC2_41_11]KKR98652.1 MAG: hypothetical protein UU48_C0001G0007 [Candidatus Uhrbacteria bacterium GW2011_GWF2_41_16]HBP00041.1 hypothetical protein [Candidatus Uhrbacteria bacterium]
MERKRIFSGLQVIQTEEGYLHDVTDEEIKKYPSLNEIFYRKQIEKIFREARRKSLWSLLEGLFEESPSLKSAFTISVEQNIVITPEVLDSHLRNAGYDDEAEALKDDPSFGSDVIRLFYESQGYTFPEGTFVHSSELGSLKEKQKEQEKREEQYFKQLANRLSKKVIQDLEERKFLAEINEEFQETLYLEQRIEQEYERAAAEQNLHEDMVGLMSFELSANSTYLVHFKNKQQPAIYKPKSEEDQHLRHSIPGGTYYLREWLVAQIDRVFGFHLVPATVLRYGPRGIGSVQEWKKAKTAYEPSLTPPTLDEIVRIAFLDILIFNSDRHRKNYLVTSEGKIWAIDNGLTFPENPYEIFRSDPTDQAIGHKIDSHLFYKNIDHFFLNEKVRFMLMECFDAVFGEEESEQLFSLFLKRLHILRSSSKLPDPEKTVCFSHDSIYESSN